MAHTNSTANYSLSQFVGTDKPTFLGDYNGDMLKIDSAIKGAADDAGAAVTTANAASALATDAAATATSAASDASTASATATTALNTANNATTTANAASATATSAATDAASAVSTATAAETAATAAATASGTSYSNSVSGLVANTVQSAIDEIVAGGASAHGLYELWANPDASVDYDGSTPVVLSNFDDTIWDAIEIEWATNTQEGYGARIVRFEKSALSAQGALSARLEYVSVSRNSGKMSTIQRPVTFSLDTTAHTLTITFSAATQYVVETYATAPTSTTANNTIIPVRILGLRHNV